LSHHPEPSGHALYGEVDGLSNKGQHDQWSVPHSQATQGAIPHLCKQEQEFPT